MRPPTEVDGEIAPQPSENAPPGTHPSSSMTEDKEVAEWVQGQLERCQNGQLRKSEKPALHAVALDKVATGPLRDDPRTQAQTDGLNSGSSSV